MIEINSKSIKQAVDKIKTEYSHISADKLDKAISNALNRAAQQTRTSANQEIRKNYNISASRLNNEISIKRSSSRTLEARVIASGPPLSLNQFQAKQIGSRGTTSFDRKGVASSRLNRKSRSNAAKGVSAIIKRGQEINLPTAFIQVANGGITVFARGRYRGKGEGFEFGKERMPIGKITTTSIPLMFANKDVINPVGKYAEDFFSKRVEHEIKWLLGI